MHTAFVLSKSEEPLHARGISYLSSQGRVCNPYQDLLDTYQRRGFQLYRHFPRVGYISNSEFKAEFWPVSSISPLN